MSSSSAAKRPRTDDAAPAGPLAGKHVGFIGSGMMASALIKGLIAAGTVPASRLAASDLSSASTSALQASTGIALATSDNLAVVDASDVLVLAVKPSVVPIVLRQIAPRVAPARHLVVSIAAGVTLASLEAGLPAGTRVVRVMPNTPCLVGETAAGYSLGGHATRAVDGAMVAALLGAVGVAMPLPEKLLDAVTGLSGSGPAYVFLFIEALADGGVKAGLPRAAALRLAAQTVRGAATPVMFLQRTFVD